MLFLSVILTEKECNEEEKRASNIQELLNFTYRTVGEVNNQYLGAFHGAQSPGFHVGAGSYAVVDRAQNAALVKALRHISSRLFGRLRGREGQKVAGVCGIRLRLKKSQRRRNLFV